MASLRVLEFDHEGRPVQFDTWLDDLQLYLLSDSKDSVSLYDLASRAATAPFATADSLTRSQWLTRDASSRLAIRNHVPFAECAHFGQHRTAQAMYDAVVTCYSSPATTALGRLLLPYLFPELSAFTTVEDLVSHLRASDARYRAAVPAEFLHRNPPPMYITLYFIVTSLPDSLHSVRDHFLSLDPTSLTVDLLEQHLFAAETNAIAVGAARGTPRPPFFEGCSPSPIAPSYASAAAADVSVPEDVGAASASAKHRSSKGKGGRGGRGGSGGGGGGSGSGGGGSSGGGGGGGTVGGSGGSGGGGGGSGGSGGTGGGGTGSGGTGARRVEPRGGQRQQQQRRSETPSPQQLREWFLRGAYGGSCPYVIRTGDHAGQTCGRLHTQHRCFSRLDDAWRAEFGDDVELPRWADLLKSRIAIFDIDFDAIRSVMYALSVTAEGDCYRCVPPDPRIAAAALGASESGTLPGTAPAEALQTFTLDSGASRCFFRDSTTLTPLPAPVPVKLADPSGGPVMARSSTVLLCPAVPSGSLSSLHLPSFSTNCQRSTGDPRLILGKGYRLVVLEGYGCTDPLLNKPFYPNGLVVGILTWYESGLGFEYQSVHFGHPCAGGCQSGWDPDTNLVSTAALQDAMVTTTTPGGQRVSICTCTWSGSHLATFTRRLGSSLYTLATEPSQVTAFAQVSASGQVAASCLCCLLSHQTLLWHHRLGHPSLPRLCGKHYCLLVSGLPRSLPPLLPSPAPPCLPCVEGRQRAAPHSSSFPPTTAPLQTLHMDVWGPARVSGQSRERYFLLVVDDYTRYTMVFPLRSKGQVVDVLIPWIRTVRFQLRERFGQDLPVLRLHFDRGGEFSSNLLREFCHGEGILQSFTLPDSPQQNGIAERCIGLVISTSGPVSPCRRPRRHCVGRGRLAMRWCSGSGDLFYQPTSRCVFPSQDVMFDESVPFYRLFPYRSAPPLPPPLFLAPGPPPVDPLPPQGPAPSGVSQVDPLLGPAPVQVAVDSGASRGAASGGAEPGGAESRGAEPGGVETGGAELGGVATGSGEPGGSEPEGVEPGGAASEGADSGGTGVAAGAGVTGGTATTGRGARQQVFGTPPSTALSPPLLCPVSDESQPPLQPASPLPALSPYTEQSGGLSERREPASCPVSPVRTARRVPRLCPPPVPGMHAMTLCPSSVPLCIALPAPPKSSLPEVPDPETNRACAASPTVSRLLATAVTDPSFEYAAASALVAELLDFAAACPLDYATALVAESASASPPSVGGECGLGMDVLEDRHEDFECLVVAVPRFASMLLAPEGDLDAPDIPTLRSYAEAITSPYSSHWQAAMDAEMASWKSTGTYVDEVPPPGANIVDGMWIFKVKRPPGSPPAFKASYAARGFRQRQGVDYFHTFSPTPKMTTLWVLLHIAAQHDYELHSLDFSTTFLKGSLHEEIKMRRPPASTQWSLRRPVYGLRQAPREWHDTLRTTLAALWFAHATADTSLFLRTDTSLPPIYVLVYVDDLVFATADTEALTLVKSELQKRHTLTDLGELRSYLGLQITRDRARRTITLTQSHMVH
ncbi:unnamed protein product [Closterium sp. NIES-53]